MRASVCEVLPRECVRQNQSNSFDVWICETAGLVARLSFNDVAKYANWSKPT